MSVKVQGLGFRVQGLGTCQFQGSGCRLRALAVDDQNTCAREGP